MRLKVESDFQTNESRPRNVSQDCRLRGVYSDTTQLNSTSSGVELSCVAINTPLVCEALMSTMHVVTCNLAGKRIYYTVLTAICSSHGLKPQSATSK